jgi:hypothetical protein
MGIKLHHYSPSRLLKAIHHSRSSCKLAIWSAASDLLEARFITLAQQWQHKQEHERPVCAFERKVNAENRSLG